MTEDPFVTHRVLLFTVVDEMLGSAADAEDVYLVRNPRKLTRPEEPADLAR